MSTSVTNIRETVYEIRSEYKKGKEYLKNKHNEFWAKYPKLFDAAMNPEFDLQFLEMMLIKSDQLKNSQVTLDDADKEVYDVLRNKYVTPLVEALEKQKQQQ